MTPEPLPLAPHATETAQHLDPKQRPAPPVMPLGGPRIDSDGLDPCRLDPQGPTPPPAPARYRWGRQIVTPLGLGLGWVCRLLFPTVS